MKESYWLALVPVILTPFAIDLYNYAIVESAFLHESPLKSAPLFCLT